MVGIIERRYESARTWKQYTVQMFKVHHTSLLRLQSRSSIHLVKSSFAMSRPPTHIMSAEEDLRALEAMLGPPKSEAKASFLARIRSIVRPRRASTTEKPQASLLHRTAYLDGLRGFAALLVFSLHHQVWGHSGIGGEFILENAFGWDGKFYAICFLVSASSSLVDILLWPCSLSSLAMSCRPRLLHSCKQAT